ncbi:uncharacterized protein LOC142335438 [Convolutriloba macropyga]|uniref:uncharacterized protein LOC142335438 n=1 Tax=Convolutriloba macropyga TaxID=536237 RepID=UPI003F5252CF
MDRRIVWPEKSSQWASVHKRKKWTGLDDYTCGFPHWAICMHRDVFGLNQQAYNTALMNATQTLPASGECRLDWVNQNYFQLHMMRRRRIDVNKDYNLAAEYMTILDNDYIRSPTCSA